MSCADDKRGVRAFRRAKTACRLCNKFAGLQRALNGIDFARSFGMPEVALATSICFSAMYDCFVYYPPPPLLHQQQQQQTEAGVMKIPRHTVLFLHSSSLLLCGYYEYHNRS